MSRSVCVFCGSSSGRVPAYRSAAEVLGRLLAERGIRLVYGGSNVGLMGVIAEAALEAGGAVTGVIPQALVVKEIAHSGLTELRVVQSMHERKALMADLADAFIAMPGGFGTLDELCEIVTWAQIGIHAKPIGLLHTGKYWDPFLAMVDHSIQEGFVRDSHRELLIVDDDACRLLDRLMAAPTKRPESKWRQMDSGLR